MPTSRQKGFAAIETLLILVVLGILGFTGWFVWHSKQSADQTLTNAANSKLATQKAKADGSTPASLPKQPTITDFVGCKKSAGHKLLATIPEVCTTTDGKTFTWVIQTLKSGAVNTTVVATALSKTPLDVRDAVMAQLKINGCLNAQNQPISEAGQVVDPPAWLVADDSASVAACQTRELYVKSNDIWKYLGATQGWYDCKVLQQYKIPASLISAGANPSAQCSDEDSGELNNYTD